MGGVKSVGNERPNEKIDVQNFFGSLLWVFLAREHKMSRDSLSFGGSMNFHIEYEREDDGRWIAEVPEIPGVLTYGATADEAMAKAETLALRALAERIETGENRPMAICIELVAT
ncbi:MAG: type II toxin-antitoxin system HicB family antitoxin [Burkholderiales bacterium]